MTHIQSISWRGEGKGAGELRGGKTIHFRSHRGPHYPKTVWLENFFFLKATRLNTWPGHHRVTLESLWSHSGGTLKSGSAALVPTGYSLIMHIQSLVCGSAQLDADSIFPSASSPLCRCPMSSAVHLNIVAELLQRPDGPLTSKLCTGSPRKGQIGVKMGGEEKEQQQ